MLCPSCGSEIDEQSRTCEKCGASLFENTDSSTPENVTDTASEEKRTHSAPLFLWPMLIVILEILALVCLWYPIPGNYTYSIALAAGMVIFMIVDLIYLSHIGVRGAWKISIIILPWYLYLRAKKTNGKYIWFTLSLIAIIAAISIYIVDTIISLTIHSSFGRYL